MSGSEMHRPGAREPRPTLAAMPGARGRAVLAAAMIAALAALAGCGGDDEGGAIPKDTADEMLAATAEIEAANNEDDCQTAQQRTTDLRNLVSDLGDGQVKKSLDAMVTRLDENLDDECDPTGTSDNPEPPEEETTPTTTETTPTIEETTTTTTEPPPEEEPPTPEQPPGEGGGPNGPQPGGGNAGAGAGSGGGGGTAPPTGGVDEG